MERGSRKPFTFVIYDKMLQIKTNQKTQNSPHTDQGQGWPRGHCNIYHIYNEYYCIHFHKTNTIVYKYSDYAKGNNSMKLGIQLSSLIIQP